MASPSMTAEQVLAVMNSDATHAYAYRFKYGVIDSTPAEMESESIIARAAVRAAFEELEAMRKLKDLVDEHNADCVAMCDNKSRCGYAGYQRRCPNCWQDMVIELEPTKEPDRER